MRDNLLQLLPERVDIVVKVFMSSEFPCLRFKKGNKIIIVLLIIFEEHVGLRTPVVHNFLLQSTVQIRSLGLRKCSFDHIRFAGLHRKLEIILVY
jgi:hypothetical protein